MVAQEAERGSGLCLNKQSTNVKQRWPFGRHGEAAS
jgi:hypothetical protein